jgi:hypothetical protein
MTLSYFFMRLRLLEKHFGGAISVVPHNDGCIVQWKSGDKNCLYQISATGLDHFAGQRIDKFALQIETASGIKAPPPPEFSYNESPQEKDHGSAS